MIRKIERKITRNLVENKKKEVEKRKWVKVYGIKTCTFCATLTSWLTKLDIPFQYLDRDTNDNISTCTRLENFFENQRYPKITISGGINNIFLNPAQGNNISNFGDCIFEYFVSVDDVAFIIKKYLE